MVCECILVGDTGTGKADQYSVAKSMEDLIRRKDTYIARVMIVGDNIYPNGCYGVQDLQFDNKFQKPYRNIHLPFYLCLGNHDYSQTVSDNSQAQIDYTASDYNVTFIDGTKKWNMPSKWYMKSFDNCDFFFLDTNMDRLKTTEIDDQLKYMIREIKQSKNRWKILCGHHTWRSVGGHGNAKSDMPRFEQFMKDLLLQVRIDLYVCGHDHCKSIIEVGRNGVPTLVIGTGGKKYDERMPHKKNKKKLDEDGSKLKFFSPELGVCHFKATKDSITLTCYTENLKKEFKYTISGRGRGGKKKEKTRTRRTRRRKRSKRRIRRRKSGRN